jgi:predicted ATP-dependent protease
MPHFSIFIWEILEISKAEEAIVLAEAEADVDSVAEEVSAEAEADSAVEAVSEEEEIEEIWLLVMQFAQNAVKIVKFHLNQQETSQFIAVHVSVLKEIVLQEVQKDQASQDQALQVFHQNNFNNLMKN